MCNDCGEAVDIDSRFRQRTLRDRLIFGLEDQWKWYINFLPGGGRIFGLMYEGTSLIPILLTKDKFMLKNNSKAPSLEVGGDI